MQFLPPEPSEERIKTETPTAATAPASQPLSRLKKTDGQSLSVALAQIRESPWNPNEMDAETFKGLITDLQENGQYAINPIDLFAVSHDEEGVVSYQIADGHSRFKAALGLGWKEIRANVYDMDEDKAQVHNYRKNRERGTINPTKEAKLFQEDAEKGLTQQEIATKYGVDQSYVSRRIASLPVYATGIKPSAAEAIIDKVKDPEIRETVARVAVKRRLSPEQTGEVAKRIREDIKRKPNGNRKFVRVRAEQHAKEVKSPRFRADPDHEFHCPRCETDQAVFCGGSRNHRVVPVLKEELRRSD
jgi:ParB family chromosome partitioning protein